MATYYTYSYFARNLINYLPPAALAVVKLYPQAYQLGALGADVLHPLGRLSAELDVANPYLLFEQTGAHIYESGSKCQLAYMLGMLVHYLLDSRINPYLYYFAEHGVPHYFDDGKDMMSYEQITSSVDCHIVNAYLDGDPTRVRDIAMDEDVLDDIAKLYERAISQVVGHTLQRKVIQRQLATIDWPDPEGYRLTELDYLNRNHRVWETVRNGNWTSTISFVELLVNLRKYALPLVDLYMGRVRSKYQLLPAASNPFQLSHLGILVQW